MACRCEFVNTVENSLAYAERLSFLGITMSDAC